MANLLLLAAIVSTRIGLYPLALPDGQTALADRLAAQLHEGAATLPGVKAFDLMPKSSCAPDEAECLSLAAKRAGLDQMISAQVDPTGHGYKVRLRLFANGKLRDELAEEVQGGPLDLGGALEHGVCRILGAAPCLGEASVAGPASARLFIDGIDRGALPVTAQLSVGRHVLRLQRAGADAGPEATGQAERRVRISYGREARLRGEERDGTLALLEGAAPVEAVQLAGPAPKPGLELGRSRAARILFATGAGLLAASAGVGLYSQIAAHDLNTRYRSGTLSDSDASLYRSVHATGTLATALAATGAGALVASGLVLALSPSGASLFGSF
jgi:hypothetical protein